MKATAYDFAASVDQQIDSLKSNEYLRKLGRAKILREELYPLSRLALCFKRPGTNVFVEAFENSGHADGSIQITGFIDREFEVQITFGGYSYEDALRDELLVAQGSSPGAGETITWSREICSIRQVVAPSMKVSPARHS